MSWMCTCSCRAVILLGCSGSTLDSSIPLPPPLSKGQNIMRRGLTGLDKDREITHQLQTWANQTQQTKVIYGLLVTDEGSEN